MVTEIESKALLKFYLDAGVNETIGSLPVNRFNQLPQAVESVLKVAGTSKPLENKTKRVPLPSLTEGISAAQKSASECTTLEELKSALSSFEGCSLKKMATTTVFAAGNPEARLMVLDRQPSVDEDRSGLPFSGDSGHLLTKMLAAIGLEPDDAYLASILPWRPPGGRKATDEELSLIRPFTKRHIELQKPDFILACGEAAGILLKQNGSINRLRGKWVELPIGDRTIPVLPIFHPGFLLDQPSSKKYAWADLLDLKIKLKTTT